MQKLEDDDRLMDETEIASRSIDMWQAKPMLYDVTCMGYLNRNQLTMRLNHSSTMLTKLFILFFYKY